MQNLHTLGVNSFGAVLVAESMLKSPYVVHMGMKPLRFYLPVPRSDVGDWSGVYFTLMARPKDAKGDPAALSDEGIRWMFDAEHVGQPFTTINTCEGEFMRYADAGRQKEWEEYLALHRGDAAPRAEPEKPQEVLGMPVVENPLMSSDTIMMKTGDGTMHSMKLPEEVGAGDGQTFVGTLPAHTPPPWEQLLSLISDYTVSFTDAANHQSASKADIARSSALAALTRIRKAVYGPDA